MPYCLFTAQEHMTSKELQQECTDGKWLPILVMRSENKTIVPVFDSVKIADRFVGRNLPKTWLCGIISLSTYEAELMDQLGWEAIKFTYPRKLKDVMQFDVEIFELNKDRNLRINI